MPYLDSFLLRQCAEQLVFGPASLERLASLDLRRTSVFAWPGMQGLDSQSVNVTWVYKGEHETLPYTINDGSGPSGINDSLTCPS